MEGVAVVRLVQVVVVVIVIAAVALVLRYPRQIFSHLTHWKGGPRQRNSYAVHRPAAKSRIAVVGDIGHAGRHLNATGAAIAELGAPAAYDALVMLGDHAYPRGDPEQLARTVFEPFGTVLTQGTELLAVLGNHDVLDGHGTEQLRRLGQSGRFWARALPAMLLVGLDSNALDDAEQRSFLERALATSRAQWKVVALHHPPYSAGYQGSDLPTRAAFAPVFERYGVHLVLSAHDHDYQRSAAIGGVTYVVTGGAARARFSGSRSFTAASYRVRHFVEVAAFDDRLVLRAIDQQGRVFDEAAMTASASVAPASGTPKSAAMRGSEARGS